MHRKRTGPGGSESDVALIYLTAARRGLSRAQMIGLFCNSRIAQLDHPERLAPMAGLQFVRIGTKRSIST
jgi:hypothetical protein